MWEEFAAWLAQYWWAILVAVVLVAALIIVCAAASKARKQEVRRQTHASGENAPPTEAVPSTETETETQESGDLIETAAEEAFEDASYFAEEGEPVAPAKRLPVYRVHYDRPSATWVVKKDGNERVTRRTATKAEALAAAKELCRRQETAFTVQKKDGKFQKRRNAK